MRLAKQKKIELIEHYMNNAETLFASWGITDGGADYEEAWQNTYLTQGQPLGYSSSHHMRRQLKEWLLPIEKKMDAINQTGNGHVAQLNEVEIALVALMKKLPKTSTVNILFFTYRVHHMFLPS